MLNCLIVGIGGFIGSVLRYLIGMIPIKNPQGFPVNTFFINIAGAFLIGCVVAAAAKNKNIDLNLILFLKVGICGGFTTFSTLSLEAGNLMKAGQAGVAVAYVLLSAVCGILAVFLAQYIVK